MNFLFSKSHSMLPELYTFFIMAARYTGLDCTFMLRHRTLLRSLGIKELIKKKKTLKYIYIYIFFFFFGERYINFDQFVLVVGGRVCSPSHV